MVDLYNTNGSVFITNGNEQDCQPELKNKTKNNQLYEEYKSTSKGQNVGSAVEHLLHMGETLGLIHSTAYKYK